MTTKFYNASYLQKIIPSRKEKMLLLTTWRKKLIQILTQRNQIWKLLIHIILCVCVCGYFKTGIVLELQFSEER